MEIYTNIITKEMIDNTIIPYTSEDSIFNSSLNEVLLLDVKDKFGYEIYDDLISNGTSGGTFSTVTQELLDDGLRLAIGYYVVSRTMRKPSTLTRYGITNKLNESLASETATNAQIVSQSLYYKECADSIVQKLLQSFSPTNANSNFSNRMRIVGD